MHDLIMQLIGRIITNKNILNNHRLLTISQHLMSTQSHPVPEGGLDSHGRAIKVPNVATDAIVVKESQSGHDILLITRLRDPFKDHYAFPGGFVDYNEDPMEACLRELKEECGITGYQPKIVTVAGKPDRDPRKHIISLVYYVQVDPSHEVKAGDDAASAKWYDLRQVYTSFNMAFDHKDILKEFLQKHFP